MSGNTQPPPAFGDGHVAKVLAKLDGLRAGLHYLDKANPQVPVPFSNRTAGEIHTEQTAPSSGPAFDFRAVSPSPHHPGILPGSDTDLCSHLQRADWCAIQNIRIAIEQVWLQFGNLTIELNLDIITHLHEQYHDATGLRDAGADAFRNILMGSTPTDLKTLLAFICLSCAASIQLRTQQRPRNSEIFASIQAWSSAISKRHERDAFLVIVQGLWPEAKRHLQPAEASQPHQQPGAAVSTDQPPLDRDSFAWFAPEFGPANDAFGSQLSPAHAIPEHGYECPADGFNMGGFFNNLNSQDDQGDQTEYPKALFDPTAQFATCHASTPSAEILQGTAMFRVILDLFKHLGELPYTLSGQGMMVNDGLSLLAYFQKQPSCRDQIVESFIKPFLIESLSKDLLCQAMASVAEWFVNLGYLQSIEKTKAYMVIIGRVS
jgi:hypothetical protein